VIDTPPLPLPPPLPSLPPLPPSQPPWSWQSPQYRGNPPGWSTRGRRRRSRSHRRRNDSGERGRENYGVEATRRRRRRPPPWLRAVRPPPLTFVYATTYTFCDNIDCLPTCSPSLTSKNSLLLIVLCFLTIHSQKYAYINKQGFFLYLICTQS